MTCCAPGAEAAAELAGPTAPETDDETLLAASRPLGDGRFELELAVPDVHCAACIRAIEDALDNLEMVDAARVNLSRRRVRIGYRPSSGRPSDLTRAVDAAGYRAILLDPQADARTDRTLTELTRALAVSGFAAGNIMLFSVSVWSGAEASTRDLFHWISALIAVPAIGYAGRPFFRSAWNAVSRGRLNMDVPIALAVVLALGLSLVETARGGEHAWFDAAVTLLFFLLIGRTLDHLMREKARSAVTNLARLAPARATRLAEGGSRESIPIDAIRPGMTLAVAAGERVPVDSRVIGGESDVDTSLVTGESLPRPAPADTELLAGTLNLSGPLTLTALRPAADSFLARMISLMDAAEGSRAGYRRIADRAAAIYAPAVHLAALATFAGWWFLAGDWHTAILNAIAVLIITCPCALALAVPIVHVVASGRLFGMGVMMRDGAALERLAEVNRVVFDKTGTLTAGRPVLHRQLRGGLGGLVQAARLASVSRHPFSRAIADAAGPVEAANGAIREVPGHGVEAVDETGCWRLGNAGWCGVADDERESDATRVWLARDGEPVAAFEFFDPPRTGAAEAVSELKARNLPVALLSGDRAGPVRVLGEALGIEDRRAGLDPAGKLTALDEFAAEGDCVLMVGDGVNDAPALAAAHVSMAPSSASDVGRNAADFVFTRPDLMAVPATVRIARRAAGIVRQNFALAVIYNLVAVPLAVTGHVTPLVAALAMSSSSILVTLNALRLRMDRWPSREPRGEGRVTNALAEPAE